MCVLLSNAPQPAHQPHRAPRRAVRAQVQSAARRLGVARAGLAGPRVAGESAGEPRTEEAEGGREARGGQNRMLFLL